MCISKGFASSQFEFLLRVWRSLVRHKNWDSPRASLKSEAHLTAIPILCADGGVFCNIFILAGSPTLAHGNTEETPLWLRPKKLERSRLIYNGKGSAKGLEFEVKKIGDSGELVVEEHSGSWDLA